jgi:hypothetical protein
MWRFFATDVEAHARVCREGLFCEEQFEIIGTRAGGGSIAFPVKLKTSGRLTWVKPAVAAGDNALTSAHEKIAADIGHALGLPVAPTLLSKQTKGHGLPEIVALSFRPLSNLRRGERLPPTINTRPACAPRWQACGDFTPG